MAIEDAIQRANDRGYLVTNLFQRADGQWQANIRTPGGRFYSFAVWAEPELALHLATVNAIKEDPTWDRLEAALTRWQEAINGRL